MRTQMILATTWVMSHNRAQAVLVGGLVLLGVLAGLANPEIAAAGTAPGGTR